MALSLDHYFCDRLPNPDQSPSYNLGQITDTHCIRLCNRIGLVDSIKDPKKVEMELWKIIPPEEGNSLCHRFVDHGRAVCSARTKPNCKECVLADICKYNNS